MRCEIVIVGGAAVVLLYGAREAMKDVDVLILSAVEPAIVREAVRRTGRALDLPEDWLNDPNMDLRELVRAILSYDALTARQWVADSLRQSVIWTSMPQPTDLDEVEMGVAAGVVELLASRVGQAPPSWATTVKASPTPVYLVKAARTMPRLRRLCEEEGPEPLRRRGILAPPEFLKVA